MSRAKTSLEDVLSAHDAAIQEHAWRTGYMDAYYQWVVGDCTAQITGFKWGDVDPPNGVCASCKTPIGPLGQAVMEGCGCSDVSCGYCGYRQCTGGCRKWG